MADDFNLKSGTFVKTILMLLVIIGHACAFWSGQWFTENPAIESITLNIVYVWLNSFHIYAFTLVSGYIFAFKVIGGAYSDYRIFLFNKVKRLLIPYLFVMFIWVAPISTFFSDWNWGYLAKKYLLAINPSQLWFLWMLFGVFVIIWPLRNIFLEKPIIAWIIALGFYCIGIVGNRIIPNIFCCWSTCQYIPFFLIGMRIRVIEDGRGRRAAKLVKWHWWVLFDLVLFILEIMVDSQSGLFLKLFKFVLDFCVHIVGAIMAWTTLQALAHRINWENSKIFKCFSSYSMPMYLFHQQFIYFTIVLLNGKVAPWINAGINFMVAIIGSFIISKILMHWRITRFLIGEK